MKKSTGLIFIIILIFLGTLSIGYKPWFSESDSRNNLVKGKSEAYIRDVKPVNYTLTFTGFVLEKFTETKTIFFSGGELVFNGRTLTGTVIKTTVQPIKKDGKYFYERAMSATVTTIPISGTSNKQDLVISDKNGESNDTTKTYELKFIPGFTKMKLLGEEYAFNEQNLSYGNEYDMQLFLTDNEAYVMDFENLTEGQQRKKAFLEYKKKIEDVNEKYRGDPRTINKLVDELNKAYDIRIKQLN